MFGYSLVKILQGWQQLCRSGPFSIPSFHSIFSPVIRDTRGKITKRPCLEHNSKKNKHQYIVFIIPSIGSISNLCHIETVNYSLILFWYIM